MESPLLVIAGAGSGKTRVIVNKVQYLVESCNFLPSQIYALTFTNKAAKEMASRLRSQLATGNRSGLVVSTFHRLGLTMMQASPASFGMKQGFSVLDASDVTVLLQQLLQRTFARDRDFVWQVQSCLSRWKGALLTPACVSQQAHNDPIEVAAANIYAHYQSHLQSYNVVDFDDLVLKPIMALRQDNSLKHHWQSRIRYLLVDEYQDTNASQYVLVKEIIGDRPTLTVVGDDDQSIYAWRGALPQNLAKLKDDFPRLNVITLEQNYRSSGCILSAANHLIARNSHVFEKKLWSEMGFGELIRVLHCVDEFDETEQVAAEIISHRLRDNIAYQDVAVLFRGNHQAYLFEKAFRDQGIPYQVSGATSLFARVEVKDWLSYLRLCCNIDDDNAFLRIANTPKRGISPATVATLIEAAATFGRSLLDTIDTLSLSTRLGERPLQALRQFRELILEMTAQIQTSDQIEAALKRCFEISDYELYLHDYCETSAQAEKKVASIFELFSWIERLMHKDPDNPKTLDQVIATLALVERLDRDDDKTDRVRLMTFHAAKGLEFPIVYMVGMEEGLLPHHASIEEDNIEEERRLAYVGMTRAQQRLILTLARQRKKYNELVESEPSRFLSELPQDLLVHQGDTHTQRTPEQGASHIKALRGLLS